MSFSEQAIYREAYDAHLHWIRVHNACDPLYGRRPSESDCEKLIATATERLKVARAAVRRMESEVAA